MLFPHCFKSHLPAPSIDITVEGSPARLLLFLNRALRDWLGVAPDLHGNGGGLELIYPNIIVPAAECVQRFGGILADIRAAWPVSLYGVAESGELIRLELTQEMDGGILLCQESISSVPPEELRNLCLSLSLPDQNAAEGMAEVLRADLAQLPCAALDWAYADFIRRQDLGETEPVNAFCYAFLQEQVSLEGKLLCLRYLQKQALWRRFLKDGAEPLEFEWLADLVRRGKTPDRWIEWPLALRKVLNELGYQVRMEEHRFSLLDPHGTRLYYGGDNTRAAERLLMKVLFPIHG